MSQSDQSPAVLLGDPPNLAATIPQFIREPILGRDIALNIIELGATNNFQDANLPSPTRATDYPHLTTPGPGMTKEALSDPLDIGFSHDFDRLRWKVSPHCPSG